MCRPFTFRASGSCGATLVATLALQDGAANLGTAAFDFTLGAPVVPLVENFDGVTAPALPAGWTAANASGSALWRTTTSNPDTLPNAGFVVDPGSASDKRLTSPAFAVQTAAARVTFRNRIDLDEGFDGGVLEVSSPNINGGAFTDVTSPSVGGAFESGGYTAVLASGFGNPIGGRPAWTGTSYGYFTTVADLGPNVAGHTIQLRWRLGSDSSISGAGWWIDSIAVADGTSCCVLPAFVGKPMGVDEHSAAGTSSNLNGVLEPGERVMVAPAWKNTGAAPSALTGTASALTGPSGPTYSINDGSADYGTVAAGATRDCYGATARLRPDDGLEPRLAPVDALGRVLSGIAFGRPRPDVGAPRRGQLHRRASLATLLQENRDAASQRHHVGLRRRGVLSERRGAALADGHLPRQGDRGQRRGGARGRNPRRGALLLRVGRDFALLRRRAHGHLLPARSLHRGAERHARLRGVPVLSVGGRQPRGDGGVHRPVDRGPGGGSSVPLAYGPDPVTGFSYSCSSASPSIHFTDVPVSDTFCKSVHFLWARGVIAGCAATLYCPSLPVTRDQMAKFLSNAFGLSLYGP